MSLLLQAEEGAKVDGSGDRAQDETLCHFLWSDMVSLGNSG